MYEEETGKDILASLLGLFMVTVLLAGLLVGLMTGIRWLHPDCGGVFVLGEGPCVTIPREAPAD